MRRTERLSAAACTGTPTVIRSLTSCCWTGRRASTSRSGTSDAGRTPCHDRLRRHRRTRRDCRTDFSVGLSARDVQQAVDIRPAAELSKIYLMPEYHGVGVSTALMELTLATAAEWGVRCVWLGVNQGNQRAQRFYIKSGFKINGTRTFQVGARLENDYVMVRELPEHH